jgi:hypothetical protein
LQWSDNYVGKLLGQKMVDEIDYFVLMPWNFVGDVFYNIYALGVAWSHTMAKNAKCFGTFGFYVKTS